MNDLFPFSQLCTAFYLLFMLILEIARLMKQSYISHISVETHRAPGGFSRQLSVTCSGTGLMSSLTFAKP